MGTPWYLEVIHVSSQEKQQDLLTLLHDVVSVTALGSTSGTDYFVVFDCADPQLTVAIERLFAEVDPASTPTFSSRPPLQPGGGGVA